MLGEKLPPEKAQDHGPLMVAHIGMARWTNLPLALLGSWLVASPVTFGYRSLALTASDITSGLLVVALAALAFARSSGWAAWASCAVGLWVMAAPLAFWAPTAGAFANDTLVGVLIVAFAVIIPMGMQMPGPDVPPGWSYNPSTWQQRLPIIALGVASFLMARYMAAFQLGHVATAWDPVFGDGTVRVLTSNVSQAWPISDAGLGAYVYMVELLSTLMGDERRWRTMPWMVAIFGFAVVPLGIVSVVLVIMQPLAVGAWCTLCLASALFMLGMIALALDEIVAMGQFLARSVKAGKPFWRTFWHGAEDAAPEPVALVRPSDCWRPEATWWGVSCPWTLLASAVAGAWLMYAPVVTGAWNGAANGDHLVGALVVTVALIALAEVTRVVRLLNVPLGAWIAVAPWVLAGATTTARWHGLILGLAVLALSLPRGPVRERYGGWERYIR